MAAKALKVQVDSFYEILCVQKEAQNVLFYKSNTIFYCAGKILESCFPAYQKSKEVLPNLLALLSINVNFDLAAKVV